MSNPHEQETMVCLFCGEITTRCNTSGNRTCEIDCDHVQCEVCGVKYSILASHMIDEDYVESLNIAASTEKEDQQKGK